MPECKADPQKPNWQNLDLQKDSVFGISTEKAYTEIIAHKKKYKTVVVGVIDSGVDTAHEDLKAVIWTNPKKNDGYPGDLHGWDFIGGPLGDIDHENLEVARLIRARKADKNMIADFNQQQEQNADLLAYYVEFRNSLDTLCMLNKKENPSLEDFESLCRPETAWNRPFG